MLSRSEHLMKLDIMFSSLNERLDKFNKELIEKLQGLIDVVEGDKIEQ